MNKQTLKTPAFWLSAAGLVFLAVLLGNWWHAHPDMGAPERLAAVVSVTLFAAVGLRFAPRFTAFWSPGEAFPEGTEKPASRSVELKIFLALLGWDLAVLLLSWPLRSAIYGATTFRDSLSAWVCADGIHYLDIARDWYLSEGSIDRLVQLVFLPGYPILVRLVSLIIPNMTYAALTVSGLCFAGAGTVLYRLLRLDLGHKGAIRGVLLLCLTPGSFFFAAPMSESLFLLCCVSCIYLARTGRWALGCLLGGVAAFTRSLGTTLLVPLLTELIAALVRKSLSKKEIVLRLLSLLLVPLGFGIYCWINYRVAGDPFQFMTYQSEHWHQNFGLFFHTAAYQTDYATATWVYNRHNFWGLWLPNLLAQFLALAVMAYGAKKLRPSYTAWFLVYFFIAIGATWLLSAPRYLLAFFPIAAVLSMATERKRTLAALLPCMTALWVLYFLAFLLRWQVY